MSYGIRTWDVGKLYKEQDSQRRVPMRALLGIPGDVEAAPTPVVPLEDRPSTLNTLASGFSGPMAMALKQIKDLYEMPSRMREGAKDAMDTVQHPMNVYKGLADPYDPNRAMKMAGAIQSGGIGGAGAGGTALGSGPIATSRIAQRVPTGKGAVASPDLLSDMDAMRMDPEFFRKASDKLQGIIRDKTMTSGDPEERFGEAKALMMANLDRIYRGVDPALRERATEWYPGGNRIAHRFAGDYGVSPEAAAGTIAATSPQKNWFENVEMARRMMETQAEDPVISRELIKELQEKGSEGLAGYAGLLTPHEGRRFSQLPTREAAAGVLAHDISTRSKDVPLLMPEGHAEGLFMRPNNVDKEKLKWSSIPILSRAVDAMRSGGDLGAISKATGGAHKVRNFYNNIIAPDPNFNDYTSDTHNIAAALLRPLGAADKEVSIGLSGPPTSAATGMRGLYGLYADAGRDLAKQYGVAPYQVQSPTWEGVRSLFPAEWKKEGNKKMVNAIWDAYRKGEIGLQAAQEEVIRMSPAGFNKIPWANTRAR
jgi:hypothetical protein